MASSLNRCLFLFLHSLIMARSAWFPESLAQQPFDMDCPPGEALNGLTLQQVPGPTVGVSPNAQGADILYRIFCSRFLNWTIGTPMPPQPPVRLGGEFPASQGVDMQDPLKNCAPDEYMCGMMGSYVNNLRTLKYKCCNSLTYKRHSCQPVGPTKLSSLNPNEIRNPSFSKKFSKGCPPQASVAIGLSNNAAQMLVCEFREAGREYLETCAEQQNQGPDGQQQSQTSQPQPPDGSAAAFMKSMPGNFNGQPDSMQQLRSGGLPGLSVPPNLLSKMGATTPSIMNLMNGDMSLQQAALPQQSLPQPSLPQQSLPQKSLPQPSLPQIPKLPNLPKVQTPPKKRGKGKPNVPTQSPLTMSASNPLSGGSNPLGGLQMVGTGMNAASGLLNPSAASGSIPIAGTNAGVGLNQAPGSLGSTSSPLTNLNGIPGLGQTGSVSSGILPG